MRFSTIQYDLDKAENWWIFYNAHTCTHTLGDCDQTKENLVVTRPKSERINVSNKNGYFMEYLNVSMSQSTRRRRRRPNIFIKNENFSIYYFLSFIRSVFRFDVII